MTRLRISGPRKAGTRRRATAVVELAVVLPILLTLLFGIIEFGWDFMVYQSVTNAAREGCRVAVLNGSSDSDITGRISNYLSSLGLTTDKYTVHLEHATTNNPTETVKVSVPYASIGLLGNYFGLSHKILTSTAQMRKEGAQ